MKYRGAVLVVAILLTGVTAVFAQQTDPLSAAQAHAAEDSETVRTGGWFGLGLGASILVSPVVGGAAVVIAAHLYEDTTIPVARRAYAHETFDAGGSELYLAQYQESITEICRPARVRASLWGAGIGLGLYAGVAAVYIIAFVSAFG